MLSSQGCRESREVSLYRLAEALYTHGLDDNNKTLNAGGFDTEFSVPGTIFSIYFWALISPRKNPVTQALFLLER